MNQHDLASTLRGIMAQSPGGMLRPEDVVAHARDPKSPLHRYFTWDNREAAEQWRIEEARKLIRSVTLTIEAKEPFSVRAFVSLATDRQQGAGYRDFQDVAGSEFLRRQYIADLVASADRLERQAAAIGEKFDGSGLRRRARNAASGGKAA